MAYHRVAIVVTHYDDRAQYLENVLAGALSEICECHVFATEGESVFAKAGVPVAESPLGGLANHRAVIHRFRTVGEFRARRIARGLIPALREYRPDLIIQLTPAQWFPLSASLYARRSNTAVFSISGENSQQGPRGSFGEVLRRAYIRLGLFPIYRISAGRATRVFGVTPETTELLRRATGRDDVELMPLPYQASDVYLDQREREWGRKVLEVPEGAFVLLYQGKFEERKELERVLAQVETIMDRDLAVHFAMIGAGDSAYSRRITSAVLNSRHSGRITVLPFGNLSTIRALMNAADAAIWPNVSAGIQQTMGTGLYALICDSPASSFLVSGSARSLGETFSMWGGGESADLVSVVERLDRRAVLDARPKRAALAKALYSDGQVVARLLA